MSFTLCSSLAIIWKAGKNAASLVTSSNAMLAKYCDEAEATLCMKTRKDWVSSSAAIIASFKPMFEDVVSDLAAMKVITYDMSGFTSRLEAATMLDALKNNSDLIISDLKEKGFQEVVLS